MAIIITFLLGIIFLQYYLLEINKKKLNKYIKGNFDMNSYIKIIEKKPLKLRKQIVLRRDNFSGDYYNIVYNKILEEGKREFFKEIEPFIEIKNLVVKHSNEELIELELTIYKNDKN